MDMREGKVRAVSVEDPMVLVVLAAGLGSRYGGLKQLEGMGPHGEIIMDYSIYDAAQAGFHKVVFVIRPAMEEALREHVSPLCSRLGLRVSFTAQELSCAPDRAQVEEGREKPWGTAHAVWCALPYIDGPFAVINADDYYGRSAFDSLGEYLGAVEGQSCALVGYPLEETLSSAGPVSRGVCQVDVQGMLQSIVEVGGLVRQGEKVVGQREGKRMEVSPGSAVSMNCWGFSADFVTYFDRFVREYFTQLPQERTPECYLPSVVASALSSGYAQCRVLSGGTGWCGVTYAEDRPLVSAILRRLFAQGVYPNLR